MRIVLQRVSQARVTVDEQVVGAIGPGLVLLVGVGAQDDEAEMKLWAQKCLNLRIFADDAGKMNHSVQEVHGEILAVSQFTLFGQCRKGRRPGFSSAAEPERAKALYDVFVKTLKEGSCPVATGIFQAHMHVDIHNDGPVTLLLGSDFSE
jgi:D-aminoacyl-tRNA deacylase